MNICQRSSKILRDNRGFTLVELVTSAVVLVIVVVAVLQLFLSNLALVTLGKARAMGLALANEQVEYLRDLPYNSLATISGPIYPPGTITDDQYITRGNYKYRVHTLIKYADDPYDGNLTGTIPGKPQDLYPYDYKRIEVTVYLTSGNSRVAKLTTDIAAKAAETSSNTGILSIKVLDANGIAVPGATVHIANPSQSPDVDITTTTDNAGLVIVPGLPPDSNKRYNITATKSGYSTALTYADPSGSQSPVNPNANILVQQITNLTLSIDLLSTMTITVKDTAGATIANQSVTVTSYKTTMTGPTVYKYNQTFTTNASGQISISGLEWDSYSYSIPAGKYVVAVQPYAPNQDTIVDPNSNANVTMILSTSSTYPTITSITPTSSTTGSSAVVVTITGTNLSSGTFKLSKTGQSDITPTGITTSATQVQGTINLSTAATGSWDIVITKSGSAITFPADYDVLP